MSVSTFAGGGRCSSFYAMWDAVAARRLPDVRCVFSKGHEGSHEGKNPQGKLHIAWGDLDARLQLKRVEELHQIQKELEAAQKRMEAKEPLPQYAGKVPPIGWRVWEVRASPVGIVLGSVTASYMWAGPVATTRLGPNGKPVRVRKLGDSWDVTDHGIYSYKTPELLEEYHGVAFSQQVVGRIELGGHVVPHRFGWRSQKCIIRELWVWPDIINALRWLGEVFEEDTRAKFVDMLERRYQCPVTLFKNYFAVDTYRAWVKYYTQWTEDYYRGELG